MWGQADWWSQAVDQIKSEQLNYLSYLLTLGSTNESPANADDFEPALGKTTESLACVDLDPPPDMLGRTKESPAKAFFEPPTFGKESLTSALDFGITNDSPASALDLDPPLPTCGSTNESPASALDLDPPPPTFGSTNDTPESALDRGLLLPMASRLDRFVPLSAGGICLLEVFANSPSRSDRNEANVPVPFEEDDNFLTLPFGLDPRREEEPLTMLPRPPLPLLPREDDLSSRNDPS